ncbi:Rv1815 family serine proteinase [Mycobacterium sp. NPDC003323]
MRARLFGTMIAAAAAVVGTVVAPAAAGANPAVTVHPGMEIRQGGTLCTLGFVDPAARVAFTAGHCRGAGPVTDRFGNVVGAMALSDDNTPDGATVTGDHQISDWGAITLHPDVQVNTVLPGGRALKMDQALPVQQPGQPVCHFGVVTGESCGTVASVNNGWFTMKDGVVSQKGDSGGPVYVLAPDGSAVIVGLFNSTWGGAPTAVSWQSTVPRIREAVATQPASSNTGIEAAISLTSESVDAGVNPPA